MSPKLILVSLGPSGPHFFGFGQGCWGLSFLMLNWERVPKFILVNLGPSRSHFSGFGKGAGDSHFSLIA